LCAAGRFAGRQAIVHDVDGSISGVGMIGRKGVDCVNGTGRAPNKIGLAGVVCLGIGNDFGDVNH
jgi:hypothetical protein